MSATICPIDFTTQHLIRTLGDRPGDTEEVRDERHADIARTVAAIAPRDALEGLLTRMIVLNQHLAEDTAHLAVNAETEVLRARARAVVTQLGRQLGVWWKHLKDHRAAAEVEDALSRPSGSERAGPAPAPQTETANPALPDDLVPADPVEALDQLRAMITSIASGQNASGPPLSRQARRAAKARAAKLERRLETERSRLKAAQARAAGAAAHAGI